MLRDELSRLREEKHRGVEQQRVPRLPALEAWIGAELAAAAEAVERLPDRRADDRAFDAAFAAILEGRVGR